VIPGFRAAVEAYLSEISTLSLSFNALVAEALELPPNAFDKFFDIPQQNKLKLVKYPPPTDKILASSGKPPIVQGVGPHKDGSFLTYLLQGTAHHGLEIQNKAGTWIPAPPIPVTLVINIGRSLEALTGGICTATTHRVNLSSSNFVSSSGEPLGPRYSFPVFQGVQIDLTRDKIDLVIPQRIRELVKDDKVRSEAESTFNAMFGENVGEGVLISRITSHQDVGARWYPELLEKALRAQKEFVASSSEESKVA
jgi:isopenicillin N synthase-like dioxygenase